MRLEKYITIGHLEAMAKVITLTGSMVGLAYATEFFMAWYSGYNYEQFIFINRAFGPYWWAYWIMITCNVVTPQLFWFRKIRRDPLTIWIITIFVNIGMWFERFVIIVSSLHRDFLPSSWAMYSPSWVEVGLFMGTIGLFFTLFLIFAKLAPVVAIAEIKSIFKITTKGKPKEAMHGPGLQDYNQDLAFELAHHAGHDNHEANLADPRALGNNTQSH
jgi:molybdopterin-containing oxidoreductase family membrane subunit